MPISRSPICRANEPAFFAIPGSARNCYSADDLASPKEMNL
jgi:hypothetical protein